MMKSFVFCVIIVFSFSDLESLGKDGEKASDINTQKRDDNVIGFVTYVHSVHTAWEKAKPHVDARESEFIVETDYGKAVFVAGANVDVKNLDDFTYLTLGCVEGITRVKFKDQQMRSATFTPGAKAWNAPGVIITLFPRPN